MIPRRTLLSFGILGLFLTLAPAFAANGAFSDVPASSPFARAIGTLRNESIIDGYADGTFRPDDKINRAELLKIIVGYLGGTAKATSSNCFPDVHTQWFAPYVCTAQAQDIVSGYDDGYFRPEQPVTFAEASKMFANAFKQSIPPQGSEWFEPYIRALEESKAIPPQIKGLDAPLTRGQMAEILWRLAKKVTTQSSIGFLNVKYPDLSINLASDVIQHPKTCADLKAFAAQTNYGYGYGGGGVMMRGALEDKAIAAPVAAPPMNSAQNAATDTSSYSHTNVQVEGVDEGDIVKTDGTYLYIVSSDKVRIVQISPAKSMKQVSSISDSTGFVPSDLYIDGDHLVVVGQLNAWGGPIRMMQGGIMPPMPVYRSAMTQVRIYDVSNRASPALIRTLSFEGSTVSTRMIGSKLYGVFNQPIPWTYGSTPLTNEQDILPKFQDSYTGSQQLPVVACSDVSILPHVPAPQYLTVGMIDVSKPTTDVKRAVVLGNAENVYASLDNLYVSSSQYIYRWDAKNPGSDETTNVYRFAFTNDGIDFKAQGSVPGHILNQFSMDESGNAFRVATTKGQSWNDSSPVSNNIYVLDPSMKVVGKVEKIALGESIYAVRFLGKRAYLVTFKTVDPLFVVDLSNPHAPSVLGQLKIPGYSNYLHPYDDTHLIGFGKDVDESIDKDKVHSNDAVYYTAIQGMKIALFDVSDVENPKQIASEVIGDRGTDSPLLTDHKALLFEKDTGLLAFPITVYKRTADQPISDQGKPIFQGAYVYNLSIKKGFEWKGSISQYGKDVYAKAGDYWYDAGRDVQRVIRVNSSLLTISNGAVQSNALANLNKEGGIDFPDAGSTSPCGTNVPCAVPMMVR